MKLALSSKSAPALDHSSVVCVSLRSSESCIITPSLLMTICYPSISPNHWTLLPLICIVNHVELLYTHKVKYLQSFLRKQSDDWYGLSQYTCEAPYSQRRNSQEEYDSSKTKFRAPNMAPRNFSHADPYHLSCVPRFDPLSEHSTEPTLFLHHDDMSNLYGICGRPAPS
eukprot:g46258.t1